MIKTIIVDDEQNAIDSLYWELGNFKQKINVIATFTKPEKALSYLKENTIDCLFLDIEMPTMDGFQFLKKLTNQNFAVVISTAYNSYAIRALKNEAVDYLLKPIDVDDLQHTVKRIEKFVTLKKSKDNLEAVLSNLAPKKTPSKITINTDGKLIFLNTDSILFIQSDGNYSTIFTEDGKKTLITKKLKELEASVKSEEFYRIHKSFFVNTSKIKEYLKSENYVILESNHKIPVSRLKKRGFLEKLE